MAADRYARSAERRNLGLDPAHLDVLAGVADQLLADCDLLDRMPDVRLPVRYPRQDTGGRPEGTDNPYHGWTWRCRIEGAADGPLAGRTVGVKDNVAVAGVPLLNGSEVFEGFVPSEDATVVTRLLDAGATIVGKTAVPAFCFEGSGVIGHPAPLPVNPADTSRYPGASSSGSAVLVAAGEVDLALGGDQGGSIRIPAAWCGCVGLKPTFGLVPYTGCVAVEYTFDSIGPMAASVADAAAMLDAIAGPDGLDPRQRDMPFPPAVPGLDRGVAGLRVGVLDEGFGHGEAAVDDAVRRAADRLRGAGAAIEPVSVPLHRDGVALWNVICLQGAVALIVDGLGVGTNTGGHLWTELGDFMHRALPRLAPSLPDTLKATVLAADRLLEERGLHYYAKARNLVPALGAAYDEALAAFDVLLMPTVPMRAPERGALSSPEEIILAAIGLDTSINVAPFNLTGHPSLSVPCQPPGELPIGAMLVGRRYDDGLVLAAGRALEVA
jgi:amidase